jgi:hypothetical protein
MPPYNECRLIRHFKADPSILDQLFPQSNLNEKLLILLRPGPGAPNLYCEVWYWQEGRAAELFPPGNGIVANFFREYWQNPSENALWPQAIRLADWEENNSVCIAPITLLCSPVGYWVLPENGVVPDPLTAFSILLRCLNRDLEEQCASEYCRNLHTEKEFLTFFLETVAHWLSPVKFKIPDWGVEKHWNEHFSHETRNRSISVNLSGAVHYTVIFFLSGIHAFAPAFDGTLRMHLELLYRYYYTLWDSSPIQIARLLNETEGLKNIFENFKVDFQAKMENLDLDIARISMLLAEVGIKRKPEDASFCFYRLSKDAWNVRFRGDTIVPEGEKSPQGMEIIRILLRNTPGRVFNWEELDALLQGFGYKVSKEKADTEKDKKSKEELLDILKVLKKQEENLHRYSNDAKIKYWKYYLFIISALLTHTPNDPYLLAKYGKAKRAIQLLNITNEDIFKEEFSGILKPLHKSGNEKNRKDSFVKSIVRAIKSFSSTPEFRQYLETAIIHTDGNGAKSFSFRPDFLKDTFLKSIQWKTEP